ncbi:MAG TPA: PAS domain-containing protein [Candidatus Acidoferrum sp.]|jgi:PAS domain S-box-containing protein
MHEMKPSSGPPEAQQAADVPELRAEEALRKSEERWRSVFENSAIGVALTDMNGRFLATNQVYQAMVGYTEEELRALHFLDLTHEDYREANWALISELVEGKRRQFQIEKKYRRKDGSSIWVSNKVSFVPGTESVPRFIMALTEDVTERKRAEQALQRSESYLAEAQRLSKTGSWAWDPRSDEMIYGSEELYRIFGVDPQEPLPSKEALLQRVHPEDRDRVRAESARGGQDKTERTGDYRLLLPDGTIKYVLSLRHPVFDGAGELIEVIGTTVDVTDRKRAEQALRRSEAYLAEGQRLAKTGSWAHNPNTERGIYWSEEMRRIFGLDLQRSTLPDREEFLRLVHPEDRERFNERIDKAYREKADFAQDYRIVLSDGTVKHIHGIGHPVLDETGNIIEYVGTDVDVTERRHAEEKLRRSETDLLEAQRISQTGSWKLDASSRTVTVSPQVFRIFGVKPDEGASTPEFWLSRNHPEDQKRIQELFERSTTQKTEYEADYRIVLPDGTVKHLHAVGHPVLNESGDLAEFVGTVMDITERKQAEEALRRSESYLAEAQRLTHTGSWAWNVRTGALFWSQEIFRIYDFEPQEGPTWPKLLEKVHPEDRARIEQSAKMEASDKEWVDSQNDFRIVLPDGTIKHLHSVARPVRDGSGEITEVVGTVMDVTEQWKARTELERAFEEIKRLKDQLHDENVALREQIDQAFMFEEIVGSSPALQTVLSSIVKVAPTDSTVLITGETGTGKELIARAIHKHSQRSAKAFISVNCASIPSSLIASELFGHEKGAFTGATQRRQGRFELAHSGTIFLDEVGELPAETQIALLRVLQERQFERVGGNQLLSTDVRVIAATNRDLTAAIAAGTFRADLFYRLNVFPIEVPPLRKRKEDIPMLLEYFVKRYTEKTGKQIRKIDKNTLELCQSYPWPGNIRELQNIVERSVILCSGDTFGIEKAWLANAQRRRQGFAGPLPDTLQNQEKQMIEAALTESKGKVAGPKGAAAKLGIPRSTLDSKIKQLKINKYNFISEA